MLQSSTLKFLKDLKKNNNKPWFDAHRKEYEEAKTDFANFIQQVIDKYAKNDPSIKLLAAKDCMFRINRDIRFSKDKTPYNTHWSGSLKRATRKLRGGYYLRIEPGESRVVGGFFGPVPDDMKRIRQDIDANYEDWKNVLANPKLTDTFGKMRGEKVLSAPRGYAKDHPAIDLLRHKQFLFRHEFTDDEVIDPDFLFMVTDSFKSLRPFFDYMSEVLTTDANGISIVD